MGNPSSMGEGEGSCDNLLLSMSEDVLIQILLCLPVISLLRFKSVCKSWRSIILSTSFIHLHHHHDSGSSSLLSRGYRKNDDDEEKKHNYFTLSGEEFEVFEDLGIPPTLDLGEIFTTIQPPYDLRNCWAGYVYFIPFGEKLALVDAKTDPFEDVAYDIWVLNEQHQHGVKESSWTKFYTIGAPDSGRSIEQPLGITNNGEFAIIFGKYWQDGDQDPVSNLQLLNLITGETKVLRSDYGDQTLDVVYVHKPCLVPIGENVSCST